MTIKKAIAIGLLTSTVVGILALGIKFKWINKENTNIQVKAETKEEQKESQKPKEIEENEQQLTKSGTETVYYKQSLTNTYKTYKQNPLSQFYIPNELSISYVNYEYNRYHLTGKFSLISIQNNLTYRLYAPLGQQIELDLYTDQEVQTQPNFNNPFYVDIDSITPQKIGSEYHVIFNFKISQNNRAQNYYINADKKVILHDTNWQVTTNDTAFFNFFQPDPQNLFNNTTTPPTVQQEVIPIHNLMLQILTMPFTFITQAFDVTLWPGTNYAFNIKSFIMGLIAIASILFIIKLFTSGFSIIGNYTHSSTDTKLKKSQIEYNKAKTDLARRTDPNTKTTKIKKEK